MPTRTKHTMGAAIALVGVMVWTALLGASPTLDPPIWLTPQPTQSRDWSTFAPGPIWTGTRADQGDWLYKPVVPTLALERETIEPAVSWSGSFSSIDTEQIVRIDNTKDWRELWTRHRGDAIEKNALGFPVVPEIDFGHYMVVAIFAGEGAGSAGYGLSEARVVEQPAMTVRDGPPPPAVRMLRVRVAAKVYQTMAGDEANPPTAAYGIFVLPRSNLITRVELAQFHRIGEPPTWKQAAMLHAGTRRHGD